MSLAWESASPVPCLSLWERWPSAARTERANKEGPPPGGPSFSLSINLSCHSEEHPKGTCFAARSDVRIRSPRPQARNSLPPSAREVARSAGGRDVDPPHPRCSSVGGDAHIAPHTAPAVSFRASAHTGVGIRTPRPQARNSLPPSAREVSTRSVDGGIVASGRGRAPPLHTPTESPCVIRAGRMWASAPTKSPAAYASYARADRALAPLQPSIGSKNTFQNSGQRPPPTFAAKRQRRDLRIAHPPEGVSKEGGPQPSLFGRFKGIGFLRKGGNRNPPFLKPFFGYFLSGKKVTRRRQRKGKGTKSPRAGQSPSPTHVCR